MYKIVRMYFRDSVPSRTIERNLTLDEVQAHCGDPETSSQTCTGPAGRSRTKLLGPWFDGYEEQ